MSSKVLDGFGIDRGINEIGDVGMTQLMRCYLEIKAVYYGVIVCSLFTQNRCYCAKDFLPVDIPHIGSLFCGASDYVLPDSLKLSI